MLDIVLGLVVVWWSARKEVQTKHANVAIKHDLKKKEYTRKKKENLCWGSGSDDVRLEQNIGWTCSSNAPTFHILYTKMAATVTMETYRKWVKRERQIQPVMIIRIDKVKARQAVTLSIPCRPTLSILVVWTVRFYFFISWRWLWYYYCCWI